MDKWERKHRLYMQRLERMIKAIYETAAREAAAISSSVGDIGDDLFNFDRYPITKARVDELFSTMQQNMEVAIVDGINAQWALANEKNDDLCTRILGNTYDNLTPQQRQRYFTNNEGARLAFLARKNKGLSLSDQVWRYTNAYRQEIEMGLDIGIRDGLSADDLSRELRSYLKYPDKLFRRVRNEHGQLVLSKAAQAFHPGRGVYRSSYMNARRLAATETNIAYRSADYERYNRLDFVVGIEIHLSDTNHNCKGVPAGSFVDICDTLAGKYPKQFKFVGWHPHCRCYVTSILKTDQEIAADNERILRGEEPLEGSVNSVDTLPKDFTDWAKAHKDIKGSPYWLKDNFTNGTFSDGVVWKNKSSDNKPLSVAKDGYFEYSVGNGTVRISDKVNTTDSDYVKLVQVAQFFALNGSVVTLTPKMTRPPTFEYDSIYGSLKGTPYYGKCPDMNIDGKWYEHEGFTSSNPKTAFRNMMNHGLKQCDRLIIDKPKLSGRYMMRSIIRRIESGAIIKEVWLRDTDGKITLLYKNTDG